MNSESNRHSSPAIARNLTAVALALTAAVFIASLTACQSASKSADASSGAAQTSATASKSQPPQKTISTEFGDYITDDPAKIEKAEIVLIPQWHFSPNVNTRRDSIKQPQFENQFSIFKETEELHKKGVDTLIVEGCEGEIKPGFTSVLNGWSLGDVQKTLKQDGNIDLVMTHIGLKAEALYGDKMAVKCGDNFGLIEKNLGTLSDIRGLVGFKIRLEQLKGEPKARDGYIDALKKVLKLPPTAPEKEALAKLDQSLRSDLKQYRQLLSDRNAYFVEAAKKVEGRKSIVIGSLHIPDLETRLKKANISYVVFKPKGLDKAGGDPVEALEKIFGTP